ncbi:TonB-dependent receptor [Shewanella sp. D64]|uniref:TonB-dependent receptor n=1 Tax=unclassified Shewanella TaxID=196818 RepID=UPI0022BA6CAD|nr:MULTISPECIES: TonB-dependent receptor [unclassified Shewanella]MEC4725346.1 TonB-dependent receptor [Shewanella sp. D64]MEC4735808.1 TonB-dependent receptor [Shewanella sp. E94]WBJ93221.1 TonB-dependent receptor [Shewanella sp. MTB7]
MFKKWLFTHLWIVVITSGINLLLFSSDVTADNLAQTTNKLPEVITVLGQAIDHEIPVYPGAHQHADSEEIERSLDTNLGQFLKDKFAGVSVNDVQNNPFQMDMQYRGFTLSPLLGLPQGISVYVNGVRFNEPFGDTINWELIPLTALSNVSLYSGSNPLFGQNTLGGALVLNIKDGFTFQGTDVELRAGSHGMDQQTIEVGGNSGELGYYAVVSRYQEEGWRQYSPTEVSQFLGRLSWKANNKTRWDLLTAFSQSELIGNGAVPFDLMALEGRDAVYTHPDKTETNHGFASLSGNIELNDAMTLDLNLYYRQSKTDALNGDDSDFEECIHAGNETLCDEDDEPVRFIKPDATAFNDSLEDLGLEADDLDGLNNTSNTDQKAMGVTAQWTIDTQLHQMDTQWVLGLTADFADIRFQSDTEFAELLNDTPEAPRATQAVGLFDADSVVRLDSERRHYSAFVAGSLAIADDLTLTSALRYDATNVHMTDLAPGNDGKTLDGDHDFTHLSPSIGINWAFTADTSLFASYSRSSRAPTPVELSCADPDAPCKLPNGFVSDPPLEQVITDTFEIGAEYTQGSLSLGLTLFHARNQDDIIFQQASGLPSEGFFANVGDTERQGGEAYYKQQLQDWQFTLSYSYLDARFSSDFISFSPNNPLGGDRQVSAGDAIPGLPKHNVKAGIEWYIGDLTLGSDIKYQSGQYYRGDEANENEIISGFALVDLKVMYQINDWISIYTRIDNLFDTHYQTFGAYGESDEVLGNIYPGFDDARFVGPGAPRTYVGGLKIKF